MSIMDRIGAAWRMITRGETAMPDIVRRTTRGGDIEPLQLSTVFRGVQVLQTAITGLPLDEYVHGVKTAGAPSPLLDRPDRARSRRDFIADLVASMVMDGNAFIHVQRYKGEVVDARILPPSLVTVTNRGTDIASPRLAYGYAGAIYDATQIVHLKFLNVPGQLRGLGPISAAREEVEGAKMARDYKARFYTDGSNIKGYLKTEQAMTKESADKAKAVWANEDDPMGIRVLGKNLSYVPLELKPADMQFLETQQFDTTQIARLLGIPASIMLAAVEGSNLTYSNIEQSWIEFADYTLAAYTGEIEEAFNQMLPAGHTVRFDWDSSRRADMSSRFSAYRTAIEAGWLTVDEVREREGMQPLKEGHHDA